MADSTAFHLLSEEPCRFNQSLCWKTDQTPHSNQRSNDSWDYWFCLSCNVREGLREVLLHDTGRIDFPEHISTYSRMDFSHFELDYKHTQGRDPVSALSPGLDGRRKCWYTIWSWRPKPSHSCQTSWGQQSREDILHVLQLILESNWPAEFVLATWTGNFAWETASVGKSSAWH